MILGHERQLEYLNKVFEKGRLSHAYLFYGPEHVGKFTVAKHLADLLDKPEVFILDPQHTLLSRKEERKDIPIEDIRELKRLLSLAPGSGRWRVVIINDADKLSAPAADASLKLLEEPGPRVIFILITPSLESIPQTIVSRLQPIRFSLVPEKILDGFMEKRIQDVKLRRSMIALSAGKPGILIRLLEDKDYWKAERKMLENIISIVKNGLLAEAFLFSEEVARIEALRERALEYIMRIVRQSMLEDANRINILKKASILKRISRISDLLSTTNINSRLAMDVAFLEVLTLHNI
jgi:DNA polymerase-3 subunit delta'